MDLSRLKSELKRLVALYVEDEKRKEDIMSHLENNNHPAVKWVLSELVDHGVGISEDDGRVIREISYWYI